MSPPMASVDDYRDDGYPHQHRGTNEMMEIAVPHQSGSLFHAISVDSVNQFNHEEFAMDDLNVLNMQTNITDDGEASMTALNFQPTWSQTQDYQTSAFPTVSFSVENRAVDEYFDDGLEFYPSESRY